MSSLVPMFPPALLQADFTTRLKYFTDKAIVQHPKLDQLLDDIQCKTSFPTARSVVLLVGPTGVGKSTLLKKLDARLNRQLSDDDKLLGRRASIRVEVSPPKRGTFDFTHLDRIILQALDTPLVDMTRPIVDRQVASAVVRSVLVERDLRRAGEFALAQRRRRLVDSSKLLAILIDEAGAVFKTGRPRNERERLNKLKDAADLLKDLANSTSATLVLSGAYDFFDLVQTSAQNARRSDIVHFDPYAADEKGMSGFAIALANLLCHLPIKHSLRLEQHCLELFMQSLGCVGVLSGLLAEALRESIRRAGELAIEDVRRVYYPEAALTIMRAELTSGMDRVKRLMTMGDRLPPAPSPDPSHQTRPKGARRLKPGETSPSHMSDAAASWQT